MGAGSNFTFAAEHCGSALWGRSALRRNRRCLEHCYSFSNCRNYLTATIQRNGEQLFTRGSGGERACSGPWTRLHIVSARSSLPSHVFARHTSCVKC